MLRNFGLSLLVPDLHYPKVAEWVERTNLKGRLVYFRVRQLSRSEQLPDHPASLSRKLAIKGDSPYFDWLEREVAHRFDLVCCTTQEEFRREKKAITQAGQIKSPGERHEKDDRHRLDDRSRYVLGWSNAAKIAVLEEKAKQQQSELTKLAGRINSLQQEQETLKDRLTILSKLDEYPDFSDLDWALFSTESDHDITVTQATFARLELPVTRVFITENEINFLAFPDVPEAMVIFGAGYGFENLASVEWLRNRVIHYWGDIDTHGFAILNQLRGFFPQAASLLMDRETLMEHQALWGVEPSPETGALIRLTAEESALYDQLGRDELGSHLRLEQERIGFEWLVGALGRV